MANGSDAARDAAHIVLLDSDFASMPSILNEGRRAINNVERASSLFLTKTLFSVLFLFALIFMRMSYPIMPAQFTFTNLFAIGFASLVLALEPNNNRVEGKFLPKITRNIIPPALSLTISVVIIMLLRSSGILSTERISDAEYTTLIALIIYGTFVILLYRISRPLNLTRGLLLIAITTIGVVCAMVMPLLAFNPYLLAQLTDLVSFTLLFTILFASEKISKISESFIRKWDNRGLELKI
jgi:cation-transporting ATPase E